MKSKKKGISITELVLLIILIVISVAAIFYQKKVEMEREEEQRIEDYKEYAKSMGGSIYYPNGEEKSDEFYVEVDDRYFAMSLAYYNYKKDSQLTMEELKQQLELSKTTTEGINELKSYYMFMNDGPRWTGACPEYESCIMCCKDILYNNGTMYNIASAEQITEAFKQAVVVENYMIEKGYGHYNDNRELGLTLIDEALEAYEGE